MNSRDFSFWLGGFLTGKNYISSEDIDKIFQKINTLDDLTILKADGRMNLSDWVDKQKYRSRSSSDYPSNIPWYTTCGTQ